MRLVHVRLLLYHATFRVQDEYGWNRIDPKASDDVGLLRIVDIDIGWDENAVNRFADRLARPYVALHL